MLRPRVARGHIRDIGEVVDLPDNVAVEFMGKGWATPDIDPELMSGPEVENREKDLDKQTAKRGEKGSKKDKE